MVGSVAQVIQKPLSRTVLTQSGFVVQSPRDDRPAVPASVSSSVEPDGFVIDKDGQCFGVGPLVGEGGMSKVYKVTDPAGRLFAAKFPNDPTTPQSSARFRREVHLMREVRNTPGIIHILSRGKGFMVMEYAEGGSLREMMDLDSMIPIEQLKVLAEICGDVQRLHDHKNKRNRRKEPIIHRDLKPANILFLKDKNEPRIGDLGISVLELDLETSISTGNGKTHGSITETGQILGTPQYMAPEQISYFGGQNNISLTPAADHYALGAIAYEILTGEVPLKEQGGENPLQFLRRIETVPPIDIRQMPLRHGFLQLPHNLAAGIMRWLNKNPIERSIEPSRMQRELERYIESHRVAYPKAS